MEEVKALITSQLNISNFITCSFHLTDFGHTEGEPLDDNTFGQILSNPHSAGFSCNTLKLYVGNMFEETPLQSPGTFSLDYEPNVTRQYPSTPAYMLNQEAIDPISAPQPGDYFSPKIPAEDVMATTGSPSINQQQQFSSSNPHWQHFKMGHSSSRSKTKSIRESNNSISDEIGKMPQYPRGSVSSLYGNDRRSSEDSFKVIRTERREINFDERRQSPYERRPSYNTRKPSIPIQTGTLTTNAAASLQKRNNSTTSTRQLSQSSESSSNTSSEANGISNQNQPTTQLRRNISQSSRKSGKLERTPSQLVALRSAPPPPPSGSASLQRANSRKGYSFGTPHINSGAFESNTTAGTNIALPRGQNENTNGITRQLSFKKDLGYTKYSSSVPPRIDIEDFQTPGLSAELGFELDGQSTFHESSLTEHKIQDEKFHENDISFENAPAFEDDDDSSSSDEGLWAKKPPAPIPETIDLTNSPEEPKKKPSLHVQILTPITDTDESHFDQSSSPNDNSYLDVQLGGWAVRPPAEVVYENLEHFFPNADLDKPIIIDPQGSPPSSPALEPGSMNKPYAPLSPVPEPGKSAPAYHTDVKGQYLNSPVPDSKPQVLSSHPNSQQTVEQPNPSTTDPIASNDNVIDASVPKARPGLTMRTKSLRVVAKEATERGKRLQNLANSNIKGALLRRKSTKMWGQKVVEVKPNEMKRGQQSKLRDNKGKVKQFVWVKGELIGKGSFGKVYLALNATAGEMIAVKQVEVPQTLSDKNSDKQKEVVDTLHSEVENMKDLDHFNIVQYLGFEALPDVYNLFLEYVPGGSVGSALRQHGRFEEQVIKSFTKQVLDGLAYLHSCGILHRDLKSDNLLIDLEGVCKISDFGISKKSRNIYANDAEMSMQGTIFWMAPEVIHNVIANAKQGYSAKVDIWSLGCVVLEMFAGRRPWSTDEAIGAMYKLGNARLAPPIPEDTIPYVSEDGKDIIDKCFTVNPEQRPTAIELLEHPFCVIPRDFKFQDTQLAKMIKVNDKRKGK